MMMTMMMMIMMSVEQSVKRLAGETETLKESRRNAIWFIRKPI
jgi:hypothetical protein